MYFIFRQLIYNYPEQLFGAAGVMAIEHADFAGVERLALVTGMENAYLRKCSFQYVTVQCTENRKNPLKELRVYTLS
jgi:hypothetical protein